jgi:hypothetical protein
VIDIKDALKSVVTEKSQDVLKKDLDELLKQVSGDSDLMKS